MARNDTVRLPAWTESDAATALAGLDEPYRRVVVLGMHTGQRRGDLIALIWGAYDGRTIQLRQRKTGAALVIPCHPELRAELDLWRENRRAAVILTSPQGRPWTAAHLTREMSKRLRALGLPEITVHGLRKLAAARLAEAGCSAPEIAAITGHRSLSMVQLYAALYGLGGPASARGGGHGTPGKRGSENDEKTRSKGLKFHAGDLRGSDVAPPFLRGEGCVSGRAR